MINWKKIWKKMDPFCKKEMIKHKLKNLENSFGNNW
jgi:hypothetical protein